MSYLKKIREKIVNFFDKIDDERAERIENEFQRKVFKSYLENRRRNDQKSYGASVDKNDLKDSIVAAFVTIGILAIVGGFVLVEILVR